MPPHRHLLVVVIPITRLSETKGLILYSVETDTSYKELIDFILKSDEFKKYLDNVEHDLIYGTSTIKKPRGLLSD